MILVWDWNGTLWEDVDASVRALGRMLEMRGLQKPTRDHYRSNFGFPVRNFYAELGVDLARENWDDICIDYHRFYAEAPEQRLNADARTALETARLAGMRQALLSALHETVLKRELKRAGIDFFFDAIYGTDNLDGASKLERGRALIDDLARKGIVDEIAFIGDTLHDAEVASALGGKCILFDGGHQTHARLAATGLPVVSSLVEAVRIANGRSGGITRPAICRPAESSAMPPKCTTKA